MQPNATTNNTHGYRRLNAAIQESDVEANNNSASIGDTRHDESFDEAAFYTDAGPELASPVERLFKILLEYAGVELSVTSSIEPLFDKLGQTVLASGQVKHLDVRILPNEVFNPSQSSSSASQWSNVNPPVLSITSLNIQSVLRQSLEHDQLHSANVQAGIRIQRIQQEVNLSLLRLIYQFYTVIGNSVQSTDQLQLLTTSGNLAEDTDDFVQFRSRMNTLNSQHENGVETLVLTSLQQDLLRPTAEDQAALEGVCWKKLRELVAMYRTPPEIKEVQSPSASTRKQHNRNAPPTVDSSAQETAHNLLRSTTSQPRPAGTTTTSETLLLSSFGWLIVEEIHYAASLGGLKVDGSMQKVQGSVTLSQRLRALQPTTNKHNSKK